MAIVLAGLAPDARVLANFLRTKAMESKMIYDRPLSTQNAANLLGDKAQYNTQSYGYRPYGVGLLIIGYDESGPNLFEFLPSGNVLKYHANAIGARSQGAKTYLEKNFEGFKDLTEQELILKGVEALRQTLKDSELNTSNTTVAVVGEDGLKIYDDEAVEPFLVTEDIVIENDDDDNEEGNNEVDQPADATTEASNDNDVTMEE